MEGEEIAAPEGAAGAVGAAGGSFDAPARLFSCGRGGFLGLSGRNVISGVGGAGQKPQALASSRRQRQSGPEGVGSIPGRARTTMGAGDTVLFKRRSFRLRR